MNIYRRRVISAAACRRSSGVAMQGLPISGGRPIRGPIDRSTVKTAWVCLCAAALLTSAGAVTGIAQTPARAPGWSSAPWAGSAVGDPVQGQRLAEARCAACHGADGNSPDPQYPKLAGQNPAYLYWQLWAFKTGTRRSDIMAGIAAALSDADAADAASFYGQQAIRPNAVKDRALVSTGERVFFAGASSGMGPPCAMCHGSARQRGMMGMMGHGMMGMMGHGVMAIPNLNGQHVSYIIDQLNRFARGERQGTVMGRIAAALGETDKKAVAEFLSSVR